MIGKEREQMEFGCCRGQRGLSRYDRERERTDGVRVL